MDSTKHPKGIYVLQGKRRCALTFSITIILPSQKRLEGDLLILLFQQAFPGQLPFDSYYPNEYRRELAENQWRHEWHFYFKKRPNEADLIHKLEQFNSIEHLEAFWRTHGQTWIHPLATLGQAAE